MSKRSHKRKQDSGGNQGHNSNNISHLEIETNRLEFEGYRSPNAAEDTFPTPVPTVDDNGQSARLVG